MTESEETADSQIMNLFKSKLELCDAGVANCRRLGKKIHGRSHPRPILVTFTSVEKKREALNKSTKLVGTRIYLNHDLTREQLTKDKELREKKHRLLNDPSYKNKRVTIYRGKIYIDCEPLIESPVVTSQKEIRQDALIDSNEIKFYIQNIQGLTHDKFYDILGEVFRDQYHFISLSETWLKLHKL